MILHVLACRASRRCVQRMSCCQASSMLQHRAVMFSAPTIAAASATHADPAAVMIPMQLLPLPDCGDSAAVPAYVRSSDANAASSARSTVSFENACSHSPAEKRPSYSATEQHQAKADQAFILAAQPRDACWHLRPPASGHSLAAPPVAVVAASGVTSLRG